MRRGLVFARLLAGIAGFGLIASCDALRSATLPEHLRECPRVVRTYFARGSDAAERAFASYDLDTQYAIYICGNQYIHPPLHSLSHHFAAQGEKAALYLKRELTEPEIDDLTVRDIVSVYAVVARQGTYDVMGDTSLVALMESRVDSIQDPAWREFVKSKMLEIRKRD